MTTAKNTANGSGPILEGREPSFLVPAAPSVPPSPKNSRKKVPRFFWPAGPNRV